MWNEINWNQLLTDLSVIGDIGQRPSIGGWNGKNIMNRIKQGLVTKVDLIKHHLKYLQKRTSM